MKKISFAQNQEDVVLDRVFSGRTDGFYIDVGACHPVFHSVTKFFHDRGWRGINIEPMPTVFPILADDRPHDINLHVGISNREGTLTFHEFPVDWGYSTFSPKQAEDLRRAGYQAIEHLIPVTTLARVCEEHAVSTIDFLKIDAESHEREVIEGADWVRFRPRVVLVEATNPEEWEPLLLAADYLPALYDGLNLYYVRSEDRALLPLLRRPANVMDDYVTYEHHHQVQELQQRIDELQRSIELLLGSRDKACAARGCTPTELEAQAGPLAVFDEMRRQLQSTRAELGAARARLELFEEWGPTTVGVVRRLRRLALQVPLAAPLVRRAILVRRSLLGVGARVPATR